MTKLALSSAPSSASEREAKELNIEAFLSYSRKNDAVANELMEIFAAEEVRVARDINDLRGGEVWRRRLRGLIEESQNVIFLISSESLASKYCSWELDYAVSLNKRLIPVLVATSAPEDLPDSLGVVHWIDAREDRAKAAQHIITALRTDQHWAELHTRLAQRAREWSEDGGSLLRGRELKQVDAEVKRYQGKRPFLTGEQRTFLEESRRAARKRRFMLSGIVATLLAAFAIVAAGWWLKQREADLVALKRQGDSALVEVESGDRATAVASLAYVARNSEGLDLAEYGEVGDFWAARFEPLDKITKKMQVGDVLNWRGSHYLKASADVWRKLPPPPFSLARMEEEKQALLVDASGVSLRALPSFEELLHVPAKGRLIPGPIYPIKGGKRLLATGHYLHAGDEDEPTFEPTQLTIIGPQPETLIPHVSTEQEESSPFALRILGKGGTAALSHLTGLRFEVGLTKEDPPGKRIVIEGREKGYNDNPPKLWTWKVDAGDGRTEAVVTEMKKDAKFDSAEPLPEPTVYQFPLELGESRFWTTFATKSDLPAGLREMDEPNDLWKTRFEKAIGAIDFGEWGDEDAAHNDESGKGYWKQRMGEDSVAWGIHEGKDGCRYPWSLVITGNVSGELRVTKTGADKRVEWCRGAGFVITESRQEFSPDKRWMAVASRDGAEEPLRLLDATKVKLAPAPEWPSALAYGMAFDANSKFFVALSANQELFIYSLEGDDAPRLLRRAVIGEQRAVGGLLGGPRDKISRLPLQFAGDTIIGIDVHARMFAVQTRTGAMLWSRALPKETDGREDGLWGAARGPYIVLRRAESFRLYHARTGTPLSDAINPVDLRVEREPAFAGNNAFRDANVFVAANGEFCIVSEDGVFARSRPPGKLSAVGPAHIEGLTGVSATNGRTQLEASVEVLNGVFR